MAYASVYPLVTARALARPFTYEVDEGVEPGSVVEVALHGARRRGVVVSLDEEAPPGVELLTPREREILALVEEGKTNAEIAANLWISPATVRTHLENVYAKLGVGSRTAALARVRPLAIGSEHS